MKKTITPAVITTFFLVTAAVFAAVLFLLQPSAAQGRDPGSGMGMFTGASPLRQIWFITILTATVSFLFSLATGDYSWTDRLWSVSPAAYAVIYAVSGGFSAPLLTAAVLVLLWGARLTFNFARRGGYTGAEDYRWSILHTRISSPIRWLLFNVLFIAFYQQILFVLFTLPLNLLTIRPSSLNPASTAAALAAVLFLILETAADEQQYRFQQSKNEYLPKKREWEDDYQRGFRTTGLFRLSRHPNYLGELGFWWSIYIFVAASTGSLLNMSAIGVVLLTLLFAGSTAFTESISASRYPDYAGYQRKVWPIVPRPWPCRYADDQLQQESGKY